MEVARTGNEVATLLMATTPAFSTLPPPGFHGFHFPWEEASPELSRHSGISWIPSPLGFHGISSRFSKDIGLRPGTLPTSRALGELREAEPWKNREFWGSGSQVIPRDLGRV